MKKEVRQLEPVCSLTEKQVIESELIESLIDYYNFEKMESLRIFTETVTDFGWLIFAFCALHVIKKWLWSFIDKS